MNKKLNANSIRSMFLDYFEQKKHKIMSSGPLVPNNDPTLLFTNAGMVQFKSVFLGTESPRAKRATTSQPCIRAGGKHNDLDNVGHTARHHTFFEMLGNFSFGDYFKLDAIKFSWDFLTNVLKIPKEKLWITVYHEDLEAEKIWLEEIKIDPKKFSRLGDEGNFWAMGSTGPSGPCSEIFYDHGPDVAGGPPGTPYEDGDRYVEIWNLVFMQYNRDESGKLTPLPKPSVDTGMGLERITAVMQGVHNNYDTDLFKPIITYTAKLVGVKDHSHTSLRVIADHIRSCAFLITEGILPSNENRGYVLRRIIRRALRHGAKLNLKTPFFYKLLTPLIEQMGSAYPNLIKSKELITKTLIREEELFDLTLTQGMKIFTDAIKNLKNKQLPGEMAFKLYDTYGFPIDLTQDMAAERDLSVDIGKFESCMAQQRERSRDASKFSAIQAVSTSTLTPTKFTGYENLVNPTRTSQVITIFHNSKPVNTLSEGQVGTITLDCSPFYAEAGGQVGDTGILENNDANFTVTDTQKQGGTHLHIGTLTKGSISIGDNITAKINIERRKATVLNHTATHLLHHALRNQLGDHVLQKGSLVAPDRLRFDFTYDKPLTIEQLEHIETSVNDSIRANIANKVHETTPEKAVQEGAVALFGEKYGETVRVVRFGDSVELCGGTHSQQTGDIGIFCITTESGIAAGIRRIEAVTGQGALDWIKKSNQELNKQINQTEEKSRELEKQLIDLKDKIAILNCETLAKPITINNIQVLLAETSNLEKIVLRKMIDILKDKLNNAIIVLANQQDGQVNLIAGVTEKYSKQFPAGKIIKTLAEKMGGRGGGRADMAEAGGCNPSKLKDSFNDIIQELKKS